MLRHGAAAYLLWLGIRTLRRNRAGAPAGLAPAPVRDGVLGMLALAGAA